MNVAFFLKPKSEVAYLLSNWTIRQGLEKMCNHGYTAIPVLNEEGKYIGTVSEGDFLWYIIKGENTENIKQVDIREQENTKIFNIIKNNKKAPVKITAKMEELFEKAMEQNFVCVVDDRDFFIGIVTRKDIIKYFYDNNY